MKDQAWKRSVRINMEQRDKKVMCVGLVCLDIISVVDKYPEEDTDSRCLSQRWQRGGNASNSCTVLSLLGASCAFMGSLSSGPVAEFVLEDFQKFHIDVSLISENAQFSLPTSVVISSISTGSRTILHMNRWDQVRVCDPNTFYFTFQENSSDGAGIFSFSKQVTACIFITADFTQHAVDISAVVFQNEGQTPCACCVVCPSNGTRTVVLYDTNLPDVTADDFSKVNLHHFKWIHWEGRNAEEQVKMIQQVEAYNCSLAQPQRITVSLEIEKTRETLYQMFPHGDVVFVSKDVARHFGFDSAEAALRGLYHRVKPGAVLICAWAEKGADALGADGFIIHSDAFPPETLVDTLGAGDTFNAAVIYTLSNGGGLQDALTFGCRVAGKKCGFHGYENIAKISEN